MKLISRIIALLLAGGFIAQAALKPNQVVVVYNQDSATSVECAKLYARTRGVPSRHLLPLKIDPSEVDISQAEYDRLLRVPLRELMASRKLLLPSSKASAGQDIVAMVLMPDLPLRISPSPLFLLPWTKTDASSVDSELALLGLESYERCGRWSNPYFKKDVPLSQAKGAPLSLCRIDGPDAAICARMITRPIKVESVGGLRGYTLIDKGGPYELGDNWLANIANKLSEAQEPFILHALSQTFEPAYPLPAQTALYFGWYTTRASGPFAKGSDFQFLPGAVAVHIHSFSASKVRDADSGWVGPLLSHGADVTAGNVWEPYLSSTLQLDCFYDRLRAGYCVAEAAAMATKYYSWQTIVLGDPLYRPFPKKVKLRSESREESRANVLLLEAKYPEAAKAFEACAQSTNEHRLAARARLGQAQALLRMGKKQEAKALLEQMVKEPAYKPYDQAFKAMLKEYIQGSPLLNTLKHFLA